MAERKKVRVELQQSFAEPNVVRCFVHPDGRTYDMQVIDCRVFESWTNQSHGGGANTSTRDSDEEAQTFAWGKLKSLLKKGYVEGPSRQGRVCDPTADVVEVLRSNLDHAGKPRSDFQALPDRSNAYLASNVSVNDWLITSDDRKQAILLVCKVWESQQPESERRAMANALLDMLADKRDDILADPKTPVRKFPLRQSVGRFTHLVVLSPAVENHLVDGKFTISRSLFRAFPAFDCDICTSDSVTLAEARTSGRGSIRINTWDREPHPVLDLAYLKKSTDTSKFLVYDPKEMERRLTSGLAKLAVAEVHARNYRGVVRRFVAGQKPPDVAELREFFGC